MINYQTKNEGMTYVVGGSTYTFVHTIVRLNFFEVDGDKVCMWLQFPDNKLVKCFPFYDGLINLIEGMYLKISFIDLNKGTAQDIRIHGYEVASPEDIKRIITTPLLEPKSKPYKDIIIDSNDLYSKALNYIKVIKNSFLKDLCSSIYGKYRKEICTYPAASSIHHNYRGGLIEHTIGVLEASYLMTNKYNDIDLNLIIAGSLLHDIGKIREYTEDGKRTLMGNLEGHINLGLEIIEEESSRIEDKDQNTLYLLRHIIISHHGKAEWGSCKGPEFPEAFIVHMADYLDSQMYIYHNLLKDMTIGSCSKAPMLLGGSVVQKNMENSATYSGKA